MSFFYICDTSMAKTYSKAIPLKIIQSRGIEVQPDINIGVTDLISGTNDTLFKNFYNRGYGGITFNVQVIIKQYETTNRKFTKSKRYYNPSSNVLNWVDYWIKNMTPLYVVTDAIDIKNGLYVITDNSRRTQTYRKYTVWDLEFTTFTGLNSLKFNKSSKAIQNVINKSKKKNTTKKKTAKSKTTTKSKLSKCKLSQLKYTGNKVTNVKCVKYMQQILYKKYGLLTKRQVDGWYGKKTKNAVKKFQKKKKLKQTGKINKETLKALCK